MFKMEVSQAAQEEPPILGTKTSVVSPARNLFDPQWSLPTNCSNKLIGPFLIAKWNMDEMAPLLKVIPPGAILTPNLAQGNI